LGMRSEISIIEKPPFDAHPTDAQNALAALQNSYFVVFYYSRQECSK